LLLGAFIDALQYAVRQEDVLAGVQRDLEISNARISTTQVDLSTAHAEIARLHQQLQATRDLASDTDPSLEHTLAGLLRLEASIREAQRHRHLAPPGDRWVVTEFELDDEGFVVIRADPDGSDPATINQERLSLIHDNEHPTELRAYDAASHPPLIQGACIVQQLPQELAQDVEALGRISPAGYRLILRALQDRRFQTISNEDLGELRVTVTDSIQQIRGLMQESGGPESKDRVE